MTIHSINCDTLFFTGNSKAHIGARMFLLLSGCGYGYSVQKHHIEKLPEINFP